MPERTSVTAPHSELVGAGPLRRLYAGYGIRESDGQDRQPVPAGT